MTQPYWCVATWTKPAERLTAVPTLPPTQVVVCLLLKMNTSI